MTDKRYRPFLFTMVSMLKRVIKIKPLFFVTNYIVAILCGIVTSQTVVWLQKVFDRLLQNPTAAEMIAVIFIWFLLRAFGEILTGIYNIMGEEHAMQTEKELGSDINRKIGCLEPLSFESEEQLNQIKRSYRGAGIGRNFINEFLTGIFLYLPYFALLVAYLYQQEKKLALIILSIIAVVLISQWIKSNYYVKLEEETAAAHRKISYYSGCISRRELGRETRTLYGCNFFMEKVRRGLEELRQCRTKEQRKSERVDILLQIMNFVCYAGIVLLLFYEMWQGTVSVGLFAGIFCSVDNIFEMTAGFVNDCLHYGALLRGRVEGYLDFCEMEEKREGGVKLERHGDIHTKNLTFSYENGAPLAVNGVNLDIKEGETIAIVGENGSGKTTLIRLLCGIFLPDSGEVSHDGISLGKCSRYQIYEKMSGVFQNFGKYKMSLAENIRISDSNADFKEDVQRAALEKLGLKVEEKTFPDSFETILAPEYGGSDLSGGQWNRIAIQRGLFRKHDLIILDEPTAAIDAFEEKRIYEEFMRISQNKTAFLVTHRLGSVRLADRVIVMEQGKVVGFGTHEELLDSCTLYRKMWEIQKKNIEAACG